MVDGVDPHNVQSHVRNHLLRGVLARGKQHRDSSTSVRSVVEYPPGERKLGPLLSLPVRLLSSELLGARVLQEQ